VTETTDILEHVALDCADLYLLESGMIRYEFREGYLVDVKDIQEMSATRTRFAGDRPRKILIITSRYLNITPEGRAYDVSAHRKKNTIAEAYVITNLATRIAANFYHLFNRPPIPVKVFKTEAEAVKWLNKFPG
jgi:hypothetical protein